MFRGPAFAERSWAQLLMLRAADLVRQLFVLVQRSGVTGPGAFWTTVALLAAVAAAATARRVARREQLPRLRTRSAAAAGDALDDAEAAAREGRYDVAAHRLYAGVVAALARAGLVRAHASKTAGDYLRELRRAGGGVDVVQAFAPFARGYQAVVYGPRGVDRDRYEALRASARPLLERAGA
ncbi:MAG TPA: DUF4129 domain-containing protein [Gemmatirosa sp.]